MERGHYGKGTSNVPNRFPGMVRVLPTSSSLQTSNYNPFPAQSESGMAFKSNWNQQGTGTPPRIPPPPKSSRVSNLRTGRSDNKQMCKSVQDLRNIGDNTYLQHPNNIPSPNFYDKQNFHSSAQDLRFQEIGSTTTYFPHQQLRSSLMSEVQALQNNRLSLDPHLIVNREALNKQILNTHLQKQYSNNISANTPAVKVLPLKPAESTDSKKQTNDEMSSLHDDMIQLRRELAAMKDPMKEHEEWLQCQSAQVKELEELQKHLHSSMMINNQETRNIRNTYSSPMYMVPTVNSVKQAFTINAPPDKNLRPVITSPKPTLKKGNESTVQTAKHSTLTPPDIKQPIQVSEQPTRNNLAAQQNSSSNNMLPPLESNSVVRETVASASSRVKVKRISQIFEPNALSEQQSNPFHRDPSDKNASIRKISPALIQAIKGIENSQIKPNLRQQTPFSKPEPPPLSSKPKSVKERQQLLETCLSKEKLQPTLQMTSNKTSIVVNHPLKSALNYDENATSSKSLTSLKVPPTILSTSSGKSTTSTKLLNAPCVPQPPAKSQTSLIRHSKNASALSRTLSFIQTTPKVPLPSVNQPHPPNQDAPSKLLKNTKTVEEAITRKSEVPSSQYLQTSLSSNPESLDKIGFQNPIPIISKPANNKEATKNSNRYLELSQSSQHTDPSKHRYENVFYESDKLQNETDLNHNIESHAFGNAHPLKTPGSNFCRYSNIPDDEFEFSDMSRVNEVHSRENNNTNFEAGPMEGIEAIPNVHPQKYLLARPTSAPPPPPPVVSQENPKIAEDSSKQHSSPLAQLSVIAPPPPPPLSYDPDPDDLHATLYTSKLSGTPDSFSIKSGSSDRTMSLSSASETASKSDLMEQIRQFKQSGMSLKRATSELVCDPTNILNAVFECCISQRVFYKIRANPIVAH